MTGKMPWKLHPFANQSQRTENSRHPSIIKPQNGPLKQRMRRVSFSDEVPRSKMSLDSNYHLNSLYGRNYMNCDPDDYEQNYQSVINTPKSSTNGHKRDSYAVYYDKNTGEYRTKPTIFETQKNINYCPECIQDHDQRCDIQYARPMFVPNEAESGSEYECSNTSTSINETKRNRVPNIKFAESSGRPKSPRHATGYVEVNNYRSKSPKNYNAFTNDYTESINDLESGHRISEDQTYCRTTRNNAYPSSNYDGYGEAFQDFVCGMDNYDENDAPLFADEYSTLPDETEYEISGNYYY